MSEFADFHAERLELLESNPDFNNHDDDEAEWSEEDDEIAAALYHGEYDGDSK